LLARQRLRNRAAELGIEVITADGLFAEIDFTHQATDS
jgi:hypothetical protein